MTPSAIRTLGPRTRVPAAVAVPLLLATLVAFQGCDVVTANLKHSETAEWRKTYDLAPGGRVQISNINGKIQVEPSTGNTVEVVAQKIAKAANPAAAKEALERIEIREEVSPSSISIETKLPRGGGWLQMGNTQVEVHRPGPCRSRGQVLDGQRRRRSHWPLRTRHRRNDQRRRHRPRYLGHDRREHDQRRRGRGASRVGEGGAKLECTNGGIRLRLPADAKASISASITNGGIESSGLSIETTEKSRRRLEGRLNGGGAPIRLDGTNGGITISAR